MSRICTTQQSRNQDVTASTVMLDQASGGDTLPLRCAPSVQETRRRRGASSLQTMSMRRALEICDANELSGLEPVVLASMSKGMWATIKSLSTDANRWRLLRRRGCVLDQRMLDGSPSTSPPPATNLQARRDRSPTGSFSSQDTNDSLIMDEIVAKWDVIPFTEDLKGPDIKSDHVKDSADFFVNDHTGTVSQLTTDFMQHGQRRWESVISAQLLLYRLCLLFEEAPVFQSGGLLFILRAIESDDEIWFWDRGNFHWFVADYRGSKSPEDIVELLELLISDRCVVRYDHDPEAQNPTAGETIGAAWLR